jgi:hypothetical protein
MNEYAAGRCFATLLFRDNSTWQRRAFEEDEHMLRLWAKRLLNVTALPVMCVPAPYPAPQPEPAWLFSCST